MGKLDIEKKIRDIFNKTFSCITIKKKIPVSNNTSHEFDIFLQNKYIGGINTSCWFNKSHSNNTGGQDRVSSELLWLSLYNGKERRIIILSDKEMFERINKKYSGCKFSYPIDIFFYDDSKCLIEQKYTL